MTPPDAAVARVPRRSALRRAIPLRPARGGFAARVLAVSGGTAAGQALLLAATPLLTRLYTPAEFGVLAVFTALLFSVAPVVSLRYDLAVPLAPDDETAVNLLALVGVVVLAGGAVSALAVAGFLAFAAPAAAPAGVRPYLWALPPALVAVGLLQALTYWAVRRARFGTIGRTRVAQSALQVGAQVGAGMLGAGAGGLVAGELASRAGGAGALASLLWRGDRALLRAVSAERMRRAASQYRRFPLISSWSALVNAVGLNLPALLFGSLFGPVAAGLFVLAQRVVGMPLRLLGEAVAQVYLGEAGRLSHADPAVARALFVRTARRLVLVGLAPTAAVALLSAPVFRLAFGAEWHQAGVYAQLLALPFALQLVADPLSQTLNVNNRQDLQLAWDVGRLLLVLGGVLGAAWLGAGAAVAVAVYAAVLALMYALLFALCLFSFRRPGPVPA